MADFATESGHWYAPTGEPRYTLVGKNGNERPTTLRDARKEGLFPSVTTILGVAAKPALEKWKRQQVLLAALTLPRLQDESELAWLARVEIDWQAQSAKARERGSAIHAALEKHYRGEPTEELWDYVVGVRDLIAANCGEQAWLPERSFAHHFGFGGKVDLHSPEWVLDFKSKEFTAEEAPTLITWDEQEMQLGAYREGLSVRKARAGIVYVSSTVPGLARMIEIDEPDLRRGWDCFRCLLDYWKAKNRYVTAYAHD